MKNIITVISLFILSYCHSQSLSVLETDIYNVFKTYKYKLNKNSVTINYEMSSSCRDHSIWMGTTGNLEHVDLSTVIGKSEIIQQNHDFERTSKEIAKAVLDLFLTSPTHKELLEEVSKQIGIGVYVDSDGLVWVTVRFN
jgi:uncharacterized protein YkwD